MANVSMIGAFLLTVCAIAGVSHGQKVDCSMNEVDIMSNMATCISRNRPDDLFTILTRLPNPAQMENPDFMCSDTKLMAVIVNCLLEHVESCLPTSVANHVAELMPSQSIIQQGVKFLCMHRDAFENKCTTKKIPAIMACMKTKLETYSAARLSTGNMQTAFCEGVRMEKACLTENLRDCSESVSLTLMKALHTFFPAMKCKSFVRNSANDLNFKPEIRPH